MHREEFYEKLIATLNDLSYNRFQLIRDGENSYLLLDLGNVRLTVEERIYDKYHYPFIDYDSRDDVVYRTDDVNIAINNIRYSIMSKFEQLIFPRRN